MHSATRPSTSQSGLTTDQAAKRLVEVGENQFPSSKRSPIQLFFAQFTNVLVWLLIIASVLSFLVGDSTDGIVIAVILLFNAFLGFNQAMRSARAAAKLERLVSHTVTVRRNGRTELVDRRLLVPEDVVLLRAGDVVPADCRITSATSLIVDESAFTGESTAVEKQSGDGSTAVSRLLMGSNVQRGEGEAVVLATGVGTELGKVARLSSQAPTETRYEASLRVFSHLLIRIVAGSLVVVLLVKLALGHGVLPATSDLIFVIALAIAVIPEAMPVITTLTLATGAMRLARRHVVAKQLSAIEDLGNITVLCTDKTGTLTENDQSIQGIESSDAELLEALVLAANEGGHGRHHRSENPFGRAFQRYTPTSAQRRAAKFTKLAEVPFDAEARRTRVLLMERATKVLYLVVFGAVAPILARSTTRDKTRITTQLNRETRAGFRHFAVAYKRLHDADAGNLTQHEHSLTFLGIAKLVDPLRPTARRTIERAQQLGVTIKVLTGDHAGVAAYIGKEIGLLTATSQLCTGERLAATEPDRLAQLIQQVRVFAEVTPAQKYLIVQHLKRTEVVGYQGDGVNDAPSLKLADVGIAVDTAVDVAKENADIILMRSDLSVIVEGIHSGREIFVNINKYIQYTMIGNFGNFFALALLFLTSVALPLLPIQLLLSSLLTDLPLVAIATDRVADSDVIRPSHYDIQSLIRSSLALGAWTALVEVGFLFFIRLGPSGALATSVFVLLTILQLAVIVVVRTSGDFWQAVRPSWQLVAGISVTGLAAFILPSIPRLNEVFALSSLSLPTVAMIVVMTTAYLLFIDLVKRWHMAAHPAILKTK